MNATNKLLNLAGLVSLLAMSVCAGAEPRLYVGAGIGQARGEVGANEMNQAMADLGYEAQARVQDRGRSAWSTFAGYRLADRWDVQLAYVDLGEVRTRLVGSATEIEQYLASANIVHPRSTEGAELSVLHRVPLGASAHAFARAGGLYARSSYRAFTISESAERDDSALSASFGAGLQVNFGRHWALRGDWNRYRVEGESVDVVKGSVIYRFGET